MNGKHLVACGISELSALRRMFSAPRTGLRILMYHAVGSPALGDDLGIFTISPSLFEKHVALLAEYAKVTSLAEPLPAQGDSLTVAVTFDDGYADNLRVAAPILEKYGIPFTVFASADLVRNHTRHFLCPADLVELANHPMATVGSHGSTHVPITECDNAELREEVEGSKGYLEDLIGKPIATFAYPYGAADQRTRNAVKDAGYLSGVCSYSNINAPSRDPFLLCRTAILSHDSPRIFRQKLHGDWDWYHLRQRDPAKP